MKLAMDEMTHGLEACVGEPRVLVGKVKVKHSGDVLDCELTLGRYPDTDEPCILVTGKTLGVTLYRYFEPGETVQASVFAEMIEMARTIRKEDLDIMGFLSHYADKPT